MIHSLHSLYLYDRKFLVAFDPFIISQRPVSAHCIFICFSYLIPSPGINYLQMSLHRICGNRGNVDLKKKKKKKKFSSVKSTTLVLTISWRYILGKLNEGPYFNFLVEVRFVFEIWVLLRL